MQILITEQSFYFQGQARELEAFFASLRELAEAGLTVREYLQSQLH